MTSSATTATAPAAIATMPTVLVRSCTAERIGVGPEGVPRPGRERSVYWKVTV